jgi:hypothetical protein
MNGLVLIWLALMGFIDGGLWLPLALMLVGAFLLLTAR